MFFRSQHSEFMSLEEIIVNFLIVLNYLVFLNDKPESRFEPPGSRMVKSY